jgi:hypothetical protein
VNDGLGTQPTATTIDVEQLAKWAWEGRIRIPHYQHQVQAWQRLNSAGRDREQTLIQADRTNHLLTASGFLPEVG